MSGSRSILSLGDSSWLVALAPLSSRSPVFLMCQHLFSGTQSQQNAADSAMKFLQEKSVPPLPPQPWCLAVPQSAFFLLRGSPGPPLMVMQIAPYAPCALLALNLHSDNHAMHAIQAVLGSHAEIPFASHKCSICSSRSKDSDVHPEGHLFLIRAKIPWRLALALRVLFRTVSHPRALIILII